MFAFGKIAEMLLAPANLLLLALWAAVILSARGRERISRHVVALCASLLLVLALVPLGEWLLTPLEDRFPPPAELPATVDGVIILGGTVNPVLSAARGQPSLNGAAERLLALVELERRYPSARLIFTGGSGSVLRQDLKEAPVARQALDRLGMDTGKVTFESQSRTTWENAVLSRDLATPRPGQTWLLVTSAWHMPRSVGAFRAAGWDVTAYPVDYATTGRRAGLGHGINMPMLTLALHEWLGLAYYRLRGWSDSAFPRP